MTEPFASTPGPRTDRLLNYLDLDPENLTLIADAASAALEESDPKRASDLFDRYAALQPLPPHLMNLQGLAAMAEHRVEAAADIFRTLVDSGHADPVLKFNLAWCEALLLDFETAAGLIDLQVAAEVPRAAALKIRSMHHLNQLEDALAFGLGLAERRPDDLDLLGALALVAFDARDLELAHSYATRAGADNPDGLTVLGTLALEEHRIDEALPYFDAALARKPAESRALLGRGMALMARGDAEGAVEALGAGASGFGDHLGSWIATGWAAFVAGDTIRARANFETALALDDTFSECHGSLAVMDVLDGQLDSARKRTEVALRLDRRCFSAALAKSLLLATDGDIASAERVRDIALNTPLDASGMTIAQAMANLAAMHRR